VDQWVSEGLEHVVICPGSRSTPLAVAFAARYELSIHVRVDERSAGFFALGIALRTKRPVAVLVTSGTAAAELHAAVVEASYANVPLLIITADRPPELHGVGAPQTIDQNNLFGSSPRSFEDPGVAIGETATSWRPLAQRLWRLASGDGSTPGPVHLNAAFTEPLVGVAGKLPDPLHRALKKPQDRVVLDPTSWNVRSQRVLAVVGAGTSSRLVRSLQALDWVVLSDITTPGTAYFDPLLRSDAFASAAKPDVVIRIGSLPASKILLERLQHWSVPVVGLTIDVAPADPLGIITTALVGEPDTTSDDWRADASYAQWWARESKIADDFFSSLDAPTHELSEPCVARSVVRVSTSLGASLVVGSSMPVRDVEWFSPRVNPSVFSNRGVNGIDGVVSTIFGVASHSRAVGFIGDLTALHDVSALVDGVGPNGSCALVIADNDGGGIFSFLPQASHLDVDTFEKLFGTPRHHDLANIATSFGYEATVVTTVLELDRAIEEALERSGVSVIVAKVPSREENVRTHTLLSDGVQRALEASTS
jgi:2-succinyl-5-enolpyruvyl-6-hydroxy-3-cyclohexene-1-carboxylate synthase